MPPLAAAGWLMALACDQVPAVLACCACALRTGSALDTITLTGWLVWLEAETDGDGRDGYSIRHLP